MKKNIPTELVNSGIEEQEEDKNKHIRPRE